MENFTHETECRNSSKHIKGIVCDVKNCAYHQSGNSCCAECISVGPSTAETSAGTNCATFKPRVY